MTDTFDAQIMEVLRAHSVSVENLTRQQLVEALKQALVCGDFQRLVRVDGAQAVTYLPYRREQELLNRIKELGSPKP